VLGQREVPADAACDRERVPVHRDRALVGAVADQEGRVEARVGGVAVQVQRHLLAPREAAPTCVIVSPVLAVAALSMNSELVVTSGATV